MNNQPSFDRGLLIPVGIAVFSLIGLCFVLAAGRITALRGSVEEVPTATVFKYALVGTEPAIVTTTLTSTGEAIPTEAPAQTEFPTQSVPTSVTLSTPIILSPIGTAASTSTASTLVAVRTNTASPTSAVAATRTPITASTAPLAAGTFDDLDARMIYNGAWTTETAVSGAYQNSLHVSGTIGNSVSFRFIGQEMRVFFQAGPSLGTIRLTLDASFYDMNQSNSSTQIYEWVLPSVPNGTHTVSISHLSGGSVNLDYIIIPQVVPTATPNQ